MRKHTETLTAFLKSGIYFLISLYLTLLMYKYKVFSSSFQGCFLFAYWMLLLAILGIYIRKKTEVLNKGKRRITIISVIFAIVFLSICGESVLLRFQSENPIEITATGRKNEASAGAEVWLAKIEIDGKAVNLSEMPLAEGWYYKDAIVSYPVDVPIMQPMKFPAAERIRLTFTKHAWSGIVHLENEGSSLEIDLYDPGSSGYVYEIQGKVYQLWLVDVLSISVVLTALFFVGICLCLFGINTKWHCKQ